MTIEKYTPVKHPRFDGIALRFLGHPTEKKFYVDLMEHDEVSITEEALVHMVGDDQEYRVSMDELTVIEEEDFCSGCGQTGCLHGR